MSGVRDNLPSYHPNARIWFRTSRRPHSEKYFYSQVEVLRLKNMHALAAKGIFCRWPLTDQVRQRRKISLLRPITSSPQPRAKDFDASRRQDVVRNSCHPVLVTTYFPPSCFLLPQKHRSHPSTVGELGVGSWSPVVSCSDGMVRDQRLGIIIPDRECKRCFSTSIKPSCPHRERTHHPRG